VALRAGDEALVRVPQGYDPARPAPLVLLLHGAGGDARGGLALLEAEADAGGLLLAALSSADRTWDGVLGRPGPDARAVDELLGMVFERYAVDQQRVAVGGFSDGASYALGLGVANGDLFGHAVAFSPGFVAGSDGRRGMPRLFLSHGTFDRVLPIDRCSRPIARRTEAAGYDVTFLEFDGGHEVPPAMRQAAVRWLLDGTA
jgi:predicted esterase